MTKKLLLITFVILSLAACRKDNNQSEEEENPAAEGFNLADSDPEAIALADSVMKACGGRDAWDRTGIIKWTFFGSRKHLWDKTSGLARIESLRDSTHYVLNLNDGSGKVFRKGTIESNPDSLAHYLDRAKRIWINDSYWLLFPFKLKDSGVTLKYIGEDISENGIPCKAIELTFEEVGVTPQNKYKAWIGTASNMIVWWEYYRDASDSIPRISNPFDDYLRFGDIYISVSRGQNRQFTDVEVLNDVDPSMFDTVDRALL